MPFKMAETKNFTQPQLVKRHCNNSSYEQQLASKQNAIKQYLDEVLSSIPILTESECKLLPIKPSPIIDGCLNNCEIVILSSSSEKKVFENIKIVSNRMKNVANIFEKYVQASHGPGHPKCYSQELVAISTKSNDDLMICLEIKLQGGELLKKDIDVCKKVFEEFFAKGIGAQLKVTSIYFKLSQRGHQIEHLYGAKVITGTILGLKLGISPDPLALFVMCCPAFAEVLYQTAIDFARPKRQSTILDTYCATGTFGLCFSKYVTKVICSHLPAKAIVNAKINAQKNNIKNCEFIAVITKDDIDNILTRTAIESNVIAVVDRNCLPDHVVIKIRNARHIKKLVHIMRSPKDIMRNLVLPCSDILTEKPFIPIKAVGVDIVPNKSDYKFIMLFERQEPKIKIKKEVFCAGVAGDALSNKIKVVEIDREDIDEEEAENVIPLTGETVEMVIDTVGEELETTESEKGIDSGFSDIVSEAESDTVSGAEWDALVECNEDSGFESDPLLN